jgi:hypothetical protein
MNERFAADSLVLNLDKTNIIKLITNNLKHCVLNIIYKLTYMGTTVNTKLLVLQFDNYVYHMIPTFSGDCYAMRSMFHISNINTRK